MLLARILLSSLQSALRFIVEAGAALAMTSVFYLLPFSLWLLAPRVPMTELASDQASERVATIIGIIDTTAPVRDGGGEDEQQAQEGRDDGDGSDDQGADDKPADGDDASGKADKSEAGLANSSSAPRVLTPPRSTPESRAEVRSAYRAQRLIDHQAAQERKEARQAEAERRKQTRRANRRQCDHDSDSIDAVAEGTYRIERKLVDYYATHLEAFDALGWSRPHKVDDKGPALGIQVGGIRCGSDLRLLGVKNNDVVRKVNGKPVRSMLKAATLYLSQRGKDTVVVEVDRGGKTVELTYHLY